MGEIFPKDQLSRVQFFAEAEVEVDVPEGLKVPVLRVEKASWVVLEALFWWKWKPFPSSKRQAALAWVVLF